MDKLEKILNQFSSQTVQSEAEVILDFLNRVANKQTSCTLSCHFFNVNPSLNDKGYVYYVTITNRKNLNEFKVYGKQLKEFCARLANRFRIPNINMNDMGL